MIHKKEKQFDLRIGLHGHYGARICAVTKQPLAGGDYTTYSLGGGYYYSVLAKAQYDKRIVKYDMIKLIPTTAIDTAVGNISEAKPKEENKKKGKDINHDE